jgi:hypothetical protein
MSPANKIMEKTKSAAPKAKLLGLREGKTTPHVVGVRSRLWAMNDNTPVAIRMTFLVDNRDMLCKRIAQKRLFFYRRYLI